MHSKCLDFLKWANQFDSLQKKQNWTCQAPPTNKYGRVTIGGVFLGRAISAGQK
jgi:hypothetical protein